MSRKDKDESIQRARASDSRRGKGGSTFEILDEKPRSKAALQRS